MNNKKLVKKIERFLSYSSPCSIAVQYVFYPEKFKSWLKEQIKLYSWSTTDEEAEEISNNFWKWFESSSDYDKYLEYKEAAEEVKFIMHKNHLVTSIMADIFMSASLQIKKTMNIK